MNAVIGNAENLETIESAPDFQDLPSAATICLSFMSRRGSLSSRTRMMPL